MPSMVGRFQNALAEAARETPYVVTRRENGFDLALALADARWHGLFSKSGLKTVHTYKVRVSGDRYSISQTTRTIRWETGAPKIAFSGEWFLGRTYGAGAEQIWALDESFQPAKIIDYTFNAGEGLALIREAAGRLGLVERWPPSMKFALAMAVIGGAGAVLAAAALLIVRMLG